MALLETTVSLPGRPLHTQCPVVYHAHRYWYTLHINSFSIMTFYIMLRISLCANGSPLTQYLSPLFFVVKASILLKIGPSSVPLLQFWGPLFSRAHYSIYICTCPCELFQQLLCRRGLVLLRWLPLVLLAPIQSRGVRGSRHGEREAPRLRHV